MEKCQHGYTAPLVRLRLLPASQRGLERHKCVVCAYDVGFQMGLQRISLDTVPVFQYTCKHGSTAPEYVIRELPESQAGTGRHKCAICAFQNGLVDGINQGKSFVPTYVSSENPKEGFLELTDTPAKSRTPIPYDLANAKRVSPKKSKKIDYPRLNSEKARLGYLGELLVLHHEKDALKKLNLIDLAAKVEHSSVIKGDGLGYDVLSFTEDGEHKFIEVKTTTGDVSTPFYMSANEIDFSVQNSKNYYLYRIFEFNELENSGKFYLFRGNLTDEFEFSPISYQVTR